jgi:Ran GTPase-activating protein (RanGAP) involved in mRNA processing and transport
MSACSGGAGAEQCVVGAKNVVGAVLHNALRFKCLLSFLDVISLQRLQVASQTENEAHINYLRGSCKWYCFNAAQSACMPSSFVVRMQSNQSLQGLRITSPFVAEALESFGSKELQILDLQNTIKKGKLPCLLRVIRTNQASLTELNLAKNGMTASDAIILAERLEGNQILTELNISSNDMGKGGAIALANIIPGMGAMTKINISNNDMKASGCKTIVGALKGNSTLTELNIAMNRMTLGSNWGNMSAVAALANAIPDMGALTSINVKSNSIPYKKEKEIYQMVRMNKLNIALSDKSLTELDVSGIGFGAEGAKVVAQYASDNGALSVLSLASNGIGALVLPAGWTQEGYRKVVYKHIDGREQSDNPGKPEGIIAIANTIPGMRAMTSLNLASNALCGLDQYGRGTFDATGIELCHLSSLTNHIVALSPP